MDQNLQTVQVSEWGRIVANLGRFLTRINQNEVGIYIFVTSCDEHGDGCLHTCYYYRANGQEVCLSDKCSDNFLYVG